MTSNDNIRHYIGDLETTEDIDVMFKHIYDLMLANGGEGSGLNADMVDGYHASDFAPASIKDEINNCIHSITIGGEIYTGMDVVLALWGKDIYFNREATHDPTANLEEFLNEIEGRTEDNEEAISDFSEVAGFLLDDNVRNALINIIRHNINIIKDSEGNMHYYLDADSVNGLSFEIVTQEQYDLIPNEKKLNPRNIYIINNDIDECFNQGKYAPPSILQAGMNLDFRINTETYNIEFSIDGRPRYIYEENDRINNPNKIWKVFMPLVGDGSTQDSKGLLYPEWFYLLQNVMVDENLLDQSQYPFLLNTEATIEELLSGVGQGTLNGIIIRDDTIGPISENNPNADITSALDAYITDWIATNIADFQQQLDISEIENTLGIQDIWNNFARYETLSNKTTAISGNGTENNYPTTSAVVNYVKPKIDSLQASVNNIISNKTTSITSSSTDSQYPTAKAVYSFVTSYVPTYVASKIPTIVKSLSSKSTDTTVPSAKAVYDFVTDKFSKTTVDVTTHATEYKKINGKKTLMSEAKGLAVTCSEREWGYKVVISASSWYHGDAYEWHKVATFGKDIAGGTNGVLYGNTGGNMDIRALKNELQFRATSGSKTGTIKAIHQVIFVPK